MYFDSRKIKKKEKEKEKQQEKRILFKKSRFVIFVRAFWQLAEHKITVKNVVKAKFISTSAHYKKDIVIISFFGFFLFIIQLPV